MSMMGWAYQMPNGQWVFKDSVIKPEGHLPSIKWQPCNLEIQSQTKSVYQWRYKNNDQKHWKVAKSLLTEAEAKDYFLGCDIEKMSGPVEVEA